MPGPAARRQRAGTAIFGVESPVLEAASPGGLFACRPARSRTGAAVTEPDLAAAIARRRTFAIISHPDAGKTTLTEKLLL